MTPSKLKEHLTKLYNEKWREGAKEKQAIAEALIDIVCEQQQALDWCYDHWNSSKSEIQEKGFVVTREALADTQMRLKKLGVTND